MRERNKGKEKEEYRKKTVGKHKNERKESGKVSCPELVLIKEALIVLFSKIPLPPITVPGMKQVFGVCQMNFKMEIQKETKTVLKKAGNSFPSSWVTTADKILTENQKMWPKERK